MNKLIASIAGAALLGGFGVARAESVSYTIDPFESFLSVTGQLTNNSPSAQTTGSTTTSYSGTIAANRTATHIEFPGGSAMNAANQAANQQPRNDGTPGSQPANYGRTGEGPFSSIAVEALRGLSLDVFDDTSGLGIPITGGTNFSSQSLQLVIDSGESDVAWGTQSNFDIDLSGKGTANGAVMNSTLTTVGDIETLTLHWSTGPMLYTVSSSSDSSLGFSGTIVARRTIVPEPAGLAIVGLAALALRRRRESPQGA